MGPMGGPWGPHGAPWGPLGPPLRCGTARSAVYACPPQRGKRSWVCVCGEHSGCRLSANRPPARTLACVEATQGLLCLHTPQVCDVCKSQTQKIRAQSPKSHLWHLGLPPGGPDPAKSSTRKWERLNLGQIRAFPARFHPAGLYPEEIRKKRSLPDTRGRRLASVPGLPASVQASWGPGAPWGPMGAPWGPLGPGPYGPFSGPLRCAAGLREAQFTLVR